MLQLKHHNISQVTMTQLLHKNELIQINHPKHKKSTMQPSTAEPKTQSSSSTTSESKNNTQQSQRFSNEE